MLHGNKYYNKGILIQMIEMPRNNTYTIYFFAHVYAFLPSYHISGALLHVLLIYFIYLF